jgi:TatD DNase family protein
MSVPLIDIGINLTHDSYDADRDAVIGRARRAGLVHLVVTGSTAGSSRAAAALAAAHPGLLSATAGVHPHHALELDAAVLAGLAALLAEPAVVAVGECGLDYFRGYSPRPAQRAAFERQLDLAIEHGKPLFLHQREAHEDFVAMLKACGARLPPAVAHCFTGTRAEAEAYLGLGLSIGITGWICDERRGRHLLEVVPAIPATRLMLETDGPYLLPRTLRPRPATRRNEPMYLAEVCRVVAAARGETMAAVAAASTATAARFFGLGAFAAGQRSA